MTHDSGQPIVEFLSSPAWNGIAAIVAVVTAIVIVIRYIWNKQHNLVMYSLSHLLSFLAVTVIAFIHTLLTVAILAVFQNGAQIIGTADLDYWQVEFLLPMTFILGILVSLWIALREWQGKIVRWLAACRILFICNNIISLIMGAMLIDAALSGTLYDQMLMGGAYTIASSILAYFILLGSMMFMGILGGSGIASGN